MNPGMHELHAYPFEKLAQLTKNIQPSSLDRISLTIGEPKHPPPALVLDALISAIEEVTKYPSIGGLPELRAQIARWVSRRFQTRPLDPASEALPVNGTRAGLFQWHNRS